MDRDKLLDRLRKLLALATSPNEHEAAAAAAQAQALMHRYQLTLADVERPEYVQHRVDVPWWWAETRRRRYVRFLVPLIANDAGCVAMEHLDGTYQIIGNPVLAEGAALLIAYLFDTIQVLAVRTYREREALLTDSILGRHPALDEPGAKVTWINGYLFGLLEALARRIEETKAATIADVVAGSGTSLLVVGTALTKQRDQLVTWMEGRGATWGPKANLQGSVPGGAFRDGLADGAQLPLTAPKGRLDG